MNAYRYLVWLSVIVAIGMATAAGLAVAQDEDDEGTVLRCELGSVRELNEKTPVMVRAEFKDSEGVVVEKEKIYVRWQKTNTKAGRWVVLSAICQYSKCKVVYNPDRNRLEDPCYGSEYDLDGHVVKGPSKTDLDDYSDLVYEEDGKLILERGRSGE